MMVKKEKTDQVWMISYGMIFNLFLSTLFLGNASQKQLHVFTTIL